MGYSVREVAENMEWFTQRMITAIFLGLIAIGIAVAIWQALPGIIKILAVVGIITGFVKIIKN